VTLAQQINAFIEGFETQSGIPEERQQQEVVASLIRVHVRSYETPATLETPVGFKETNSRKGSLSNIALQANLITQINSMTDRLVTAIENIPTQAPNPNFLNGINWAPLVHGLVNVVITQLGGSPVSFPSPPAQAATPPATPASTQPSEVMIKSLINEALNPLETKVSSLEAALQNVVTSTSNQIVALTQNLNNLTNSTNAQISELISIVKSQVTPTSSGGNSNNESNGGGTSSAPATPTVQETAPKGISSEEFSKLHAANLAAMENAEITTGGLNHPSIEQCVKNLGFDPLSPPPSEIKENQLTVMPEIEVLLPEKEKPDLNNKIVTADLEALICPTTGKNIVYMAAWYNGEAENILDITQYGNNTQTMLEQFWIDLINNNQGRTCFFHNFGGYDAILSMPALLNLPFTFSPIMKDGELISIKAT
jgi:hypothetical protein